MQSNVSRRNFFKGAGLAAVGALTAGTLSGCGQGYATADPANPSTSVSMVSAMSASSMTGGAPSQEGPPKSPVLGLAGSAVA